MKKLILTILFCLITSICFAQDYYVYIRTYNRYGVLSTDSPGRSKVGDIVDIRPADYALSEAEKKEWLIIKVSDLTPEEINDYKSSWEEQIGINKDNQPILKTLAYRKNKIDITGLGLQEKSGEIKVKISVTALKNKISVKTSQDLLTYREGQKRYAQWALSRLLKRMAFDLLIPPAYCSTVVSTINKTGQDYDTLTLWEDAKDGDLVTAQTIQEADCYDDDGILSDQLTVDGSTTSADYYMYVTVPIGERHTGIAGTGFRINASSTTTSGLVMSDDYTLVEWIELYNFGANGYAKKGVDLNNAGCVLRNSIIHDAATLNGANGVCIFMGSTSKIMNCLVYDDQGKGIVTGYSAATEAYNTTVYMNGDLRCYYNGGEYLQTSTMKVVNCIGITGATAAFADSAYGSWTADSNYNMSDDTTAPGANSVKSVGPATQFVSVASGSEDLHLVSGSNAIDVGTDLINTPTDVKYDIDNYDRDATAVTWDIGADEYVATGGGAVKEIKFQGGSILMNNFVSQQ